MMSGYSEESLLKKLEDLKISTPSIQGVSLWIMHHKKHYRTTVKTWYNHFTSVTGGERKLTLLYLANDVVQNARKKHPETGSEFGLVMKEVFAHLAGVELDVKTVERIARLVHVWRDRQIFEKEIQDEISRIWKDKSGDKGLTKAKHKSSSESLNSEPSKKKARVDGLDTKKSNGEIASDEQQLVTALSGLQRLVSVQTEDLNRVENFPDEWKEEELEEATKLLTRCTSRLQAEVDRRKKVGKMLAVLVKKQQNQLSEAESRLVNIQNLQASVQKLHSGRQSLESAFSSGSGDEGGQKYTKTSDVIDELF